MHASIIILWAHTMGLQTLSSWVLNSCSHQPPKQPLHPLPIPIFSTSTEPLITLLEALHFSHCLQIEEITVPLGTGQTLLLSKHQPVSIPQKQSELRSYLSHKAANNVSGGLIWHFQIKRDCFVAWSGYRGMLVVNYRPHMTTWAWNGHSVLIYFHCLIS